MIKCIALDLDGTTLSNDKNISDKTKHALEAAISKGIHVVIASGRCLDALPKAVTEIKGIEYAITSNGAAVYDMKTKNCLQRITLCPENIDQILALTRDLTVTHEVFVNGIPYAKREYVENPLAYGSTPYAVEYIKNTRQPIDDIFAFIDEHKNEIDGLDLLSMNGELRDILWKKLEKLEPKLYITSSVLNRIETSSPKAGKHNGLAFLLETLKISPEETAAFGDADNDKEMLSFVKYGMAMANASRLCKEAAWKIVPSNTEDGVAVGIENLLNMERYL